MSVTNHCSNHDIKRYKTVQPALPVPPVWLSCSATGAWCRAWGSKTHAQVAADLFAGSASSTAEHVSQGPTMRALTRSVTQIDTGKALPSAAPTYGIPRATSTGIPLPSSSGSAKRDHWCRHIHTHMHNTLQVHKHTHITHGSLQYLFLFAQHPFPVSQVLLPNSWVPYSPGSAHLMLAGKPTY